MGKCKRKCVGFGPHEGRCENKPGAAWGPHWCERCDKLRREHITKRLTELQESFKEGR